MKLENIIIIPINNQITEEKKKHLFEVLNNFPLEGGASCKTIMEADISTKGNEFLGEAISLSPEISNPDVRFEFNLSSLPRNYSTFYFFGERNKPAVVISELGSTDGTNLLIKRRYYIYSSPMDSPLGMRS